jgi:hypothetical protein
VDCSPQVLPGGVFSRDGTFSPPRSLEGDLVQWPVPLEGWLVVLANREPTVIPEEQCCSAVLPTARDRVLGPGGCHGLAVALNAELCAPRLAVGLETQRDLHGARRDECLIPRKDAVSADVQRTDQATALHVEGETIVPVPQRKEDALRAIGHL